MTFANRIQDLISGGGIGNLTTAGTPPDATFFTLANLPGGVGASTGYVLKDGTALEIGRLTIVSVSPYVFSRAVAQSTAGGTTPINCSVGATLMVCATAADFLAFVDLASVQTLTNKRHTPRVLALSGAIGSPAYSTDSYDVIECLAVSANITSFSTNQTGTPVKGDTLTFHITDNGTARTIGWDVKFEDSSISRPATTVAGQKLSVWFEWNAATSKWRLTGYA